MKAPVAQPEIREVMDIRQAAHYMGISADSLYRYASTGFIPAFRLGNTPGPRRSRATGTETPYRLGSIGWSSSTSRVTRA